jgi:hypothetical protein
VIRPQVKPRWYPSATTHPAAVEVWWRVIEEDGSRPPFQKLGTFPVGHTIQIPYNPDLDKDVEVSTISVSAAGVKSVSHPDDGVRATVPVRRDLTKPEIGINQATAEVISVGITGFKRFARKRKLRVADNPAMADASVVVFDSDSYVDSELPRYVDISREAVIVADFAWSGTDPAGHGFTKTGTGEGLASSAGWKITTIGSDAKTFYSKSSFPVNPFANGFTLEVVPPIVNQTDSVAGPASCVAARVEDGHYLYELQFDEGEVRLNGGASHGHAGAKVRLVVAPGGATADLWIGAGKVEENMAGAASSQAALTFGDLADGEDSEAVWSSLEYALTPQDPALAANIYIGISHSSGSVYGPESDILQATFANETGAGGSTGGFDPTPRDNWKLDQSNL